MIYTDKDRIIALAAVFQSSGLVHELATTGCVDKVSFETCINSLFIFSPESVNDLYTESGLQFGFKTLKNILTKTVDIKHNHLLRYALTLIKLEKKVKKNNFIQDCIRQGIKQITRQKKYLEETSDTSIANSRVIASLSSLYKESISTLTPQIKVVGQPQYLQIEMNANRVRSLLLAGIRSVILWRQLGGSSWHLILPNKRKRILNVLNTQVNISV